MSGTVHFDRAGDIAVLVIDNPPVNASSAAVRGALLAALERVAGDDGIAGAVLIGAGKSFIAGSDLREFDLPLAPPQLPAVIAAVEALPKPVVAALHGAALGGGYELALGCDARIAAPGAVLGLPETTLGIIPGAGGTQRLPRLVGVARALALICAGTRVSAERALELGMIDALASDDLHGQAVDRARAMAGQKARVIDRPVPPEAPEDIDTAAATALRKGRNRPHIAAAITHVRAAAATPPAQGLAEERATFEALRTAPEARALRHIFFAERAAARGAEGRTAKPLPVRAPGVLGAGTMGAGIATALLLAGLPVTLADASPQALERGRQTVQAALAKAAEAGKLPADKLQQTQDRLRLVPAAADLAACDLVIEAIIEDLPAKQAVFAELDRITAPEAILATNTSYLDIDDIAAATTRPERVIGLHFFSPAHVMKLAEVIAGARSADSAMATGLSLARKLGKTPVEAGNAFGFIGNRIYSAYRSACEFMLEDGALPHEVDAALEEFGFAMGPFAVTDMSGLDIAWAMRRARAHLRDPADRYVHIPDLLCEMGRFGRKTGAGYYRYVDSKRPARDPEVDALIIAQSQEKGIARVPLDAATIQRRALAAMVNEAGLLIAEGVALRPGDVDVVMVNGYGFPRWRGGPLHWAAAQDGAALQAECAEFARTSGPSRKAADLAALGITPAPDPQAG